MLFKKLLICLAFLVCLPAFAQECVQPAAPGIPSGRSATEKEMHDTMNAVKAFIAQGEVFRQCVDKQLKIIGDNTGHPLHDVLVETYQDSLDTEDLVAETFNTQLRIFRSNN